MITAAHTIIHSTDADRNFFRNVLKFPSVDAGRGWLIFKLPAAEAAFHPGEDNDMHELYLMTDDLKAEIARLKKKGVKCSKVTEAPWGSLAMIVLPGGGDIGSYQPEHPTALRLAASL